MLSPEEDFETWVFLFKETCQPKGDYILLLPDFTRLISFYAENSSLPESLADFNYEFINDTAFSLLNLLLNLTFLSEEELVSVKDSIKTIINLSTIGLKNNIPSCNKLLLDCLQNNQSFYQKNYNSYKNLNTSYTTLYLEIFQFFLEEGPLQNLIDIVITKPTIENFSLFASIFTNKLYHFQAGQSFQLLQNIQEPLIKFFSQFDNANLRDADKKSLTEITKFLGQYITPEETFFPLRDSLLNFGNLCLRSSYVDKNLIGSDILSKISSTFPDYFQKFSKDTQLIDFLFSNDIHETVLSQLSSIASNIFKNEPANIDQLSQIYTRAELSHPSQKEAINKFLVGILSSSDENTIELFIKKLTDEKKLTLDLINLLQAFINEAAIKNPEGVSYVTRYILSLLDKNTDDFSLVEEAINKLSKCVMTVNFRQTIYDYLIIKISSGPIPDEQYHSVKQLIKKSVLITTGEEVKQLVEVCISNNQIKLIKSIAMNSYLKFPPSTLEKLTINEEGWSILSKIIKKRGFSAFESSSAKFSEIISNLKIEEASMTQFLVIKEFLLTQGVENKKLTKYSQANSSIGSYYKVIDPRIDGMETIYKFITVTKDEKVNENALLFLLELYDTVSAVYFNLFSYDIDHQLHSEEIISISKSINNDNSDLHSIFPRDQQLVLSKLLKMVTSMINLAEKNIDISDSPVKSHKIFHKNKITFTIRFGNEQKDVTVNSSITGNDLNGIISPKFGRKKEFYTILTENGSTVKYSDPISSIGVHNGSLLVVTDPEKYAKIDPTGDKLQMLEILSKSNTSEIYFNIMKNGNLEKELQDNIWKFLMLMPSVPNITIDWLNNAKSQMEIRYIIQFFSNNKSEDDKIYEKVIEMICHSQIQSFGLSDALKLIRFHINFKSPEDAKLFVDFILNSLINDEMTKMKQLIIDILITYSCRYQPFLTSQLLSDEQRFSDIVLKTPNPHFPRLSAIFLHLTNYPKAFSMLLSLIDKVINRADIIDEYFKLLNVVFNDSCDFGAAINTCIRLLDQQDEQSSLKFVCCSFLSAVFSKKPSLITEYSTKLFEPLLKTVFVLSNTTQQEMIIDLLLLFCKDNENCKKKFFDALYNHFDSIKTDRWNYDPAMNTKSPTGFNGLRNMGATCYMNSVFQQLFFNSEFTRNLLKQRYQEDCLIQLRALFIKMMKSIRGVVDTSGFVSNWKINNVPVNPREQQDACEFLLHLLDKLHDELYKGEQVSINEGENADYRSESIEPFCNLTLEVKDHSSFEDSFASYLQKISVSGYFAENLQKKINILRYFRIKKAPKFLVVQLNRFEYDIVTWKKVKINDKFVFPLEFDIAPLTESGSSEEKKLYSLVGIINHCGTMEGGHYQSYIKRGDKWFNFNDSSVSEANEKTLLEEAYGTEKTASNPHYYEEEAFNRQSAYLLFYVRKENMESFSSQSSFDDEIDSNNYDLELMKQINEDNNDFIHMQSAFGTAMLNTVMNLNDFKLSATYFLNVFTHSCDSAMTRKFSDHFIEILSKSADNNYYNQMMTMFADKSKDILESILHTDSAVFKSIQEIINTVIEHCDIEKSRVFALDMFQYIPSVMNNWRCVHRFFEILMTYCNRDIEFVRKEEIPQKLLVLIKSVLENTKSSVYLKNVNFSSFFIFINDHIKENILEKDSLTDLCSLSSTALQSLEQVDSFMKIIKSCSELGFVDINTIVDKLILQSKEITPTIILSLSDQFLSNDKITELFQNPRFSKSGLVTSIRDNLLNDKSSLRQKLIDNGDILFYLITCDDREAVKEMEGIYLEIFSDVPALNDYPRAEGASNDYEKMTWVDKDASYVINKDYDDMQKILKTFIRGINHMNEKPSSFFYGPKITKKFNQMIRVFIWLILRTHCQLSDDEMNTIFKFFEVLHQQSIKDNTMMIEMCRLLSVLPRRELIVQQIDNLLTYIFCAEYNSVCYRSAFIVFIESMKSDIISNPNCFNSMISNEGFEKAFGATSTSKQDKVFKNFIEILVEIKPDISTLIKPNFSMLLMKHIDILLIGLPYAKKFNDANSIDNTSFEELINNIYSLFINVLFCEDLFSSRNYEALKASFDYLHQEFEKRRGNIFVLEKDEEVKNETDFINSIRTCIAYACSMLTKPTFEPYNHVIAQFIIDTAMSNVIFEGDILSTILDNQKNTKGVMNLLVLSRIGDQDVRNNVGIELSSKNSVELNTFLIDLALYLIDKDGIQDWTRNLINNICSSKENVILLMLDLFAKISTLMNVSELEKIAELLNSCGNKEKMHAILQKIFEKRPEVKEQVLAAANIEDDRF